MSQSLSNLIIQKIGSWLLKNQPYAYNSHLFNFHQICQEIQPADLLLIEGHSRASTIIGHITQSVWTHASLYIGTIDDLKNKELRDKIKPHCDQYGTKQLLIESLIGKGTVLTPLTLYQQEHIRLLRPHGLTKEDAQKVIASAMSRVGMQYDVRHLLDLARFLFPWGLYPRRWRSTLFEHNALQPTKDICSSMIAEAFESVNYPILPLIEENSDNEVEFIRRNNQLYTPNDFDYSPYFDVIKLPCYPLDPAGAYHDLPWKKNAISDDEGLKITTLSSP